VTESGTLIIIDIWAGRTRF